MRAITSNQAKNQLDELIDRVILDVDLHPLTYQSLLILSTI